METLSVTNYICSGCGRLVIDCVLINVLTGKPYTQKVNCICHELEEKRKAEEEERMKRKQRIERLFANAGLGSKLQKCNFQNFNPAVETKKAFEKCLDYADNFPEYAKDGRGLLLIGKYGVGKSHLAAAIINKLVPQGYSCIFKTTPNLLREIRNSFDTGTEAEYMSGILNCDLLILDDIGAEHLKDWGEERLYIVIDSRYSNNKPIIYTSNCSGKELESKLGGRSLSRILGACEKEVILAKDYRTKDLRGA